MKKLVLIILLSSLFRGFALENYIGYTAEEAFNNIGAPDYMFSQRGESNTEDDIVFFYNDRLYLYFNENRVWQVRLDGEYKGESNGLSMGMAMDDVVNNMGEPIYRDETSIVYRWKDFGYPTLIRLYFKDSKLDDLYFYRGDY